MPSNAKVPQNKAARVPKLYSPKTMMQIPNPKMVVTFIPAFYSKERGPYHHIVKKEPMRCCQELKPSKLL
jgi:hypothetical protein